MAKLLDIQLRLHPKEQFFPTTKDYQSVHEYPVYYKIGSYAFNGQRYTSVIYEVHYAANGAIGFNSMDIHNPSLGYHDKDTERIIVLYKSDRPVHIFFSAHAQEGLWYTPDQCEFTDDGRLIVYASLNSHSHHPKSGTNWRVFGFANDYCSKKGRHLNLVAMKDDSISYRAQNEEVINTAFKRFMLPWYQRFIPQLKKKQAQQEAKDNENV